MRLYKFVNRQLVNKKKRCMSYLPVPLYVLFLSLKIRLILSEKQFPNDPQKRNPLL